MCLGATDISSYTCIVIVPAFRVLESQFIVPCSCKTQLTYMFVKCQEIYFFLCNASV